jgi:hypothetical protein
MTHGGSGLGLVGGPGFCSGSPGFRILLGPTGFLAPPEAWPPVGSSPGFSRFHSQLRSLSLSRSASLLSLSLCLSISLGDSPSLTISPSLFFLYWDEGRKERRPKRREKRKGRGKKVEEGSGFILHLSHFRLSHCFPSPTIVSLRLGWRK